MAPVGIKYYKCINNGVGIIIYPQLRGTDDPSNSIIWDGREVSGFKYLTTVGQETIVNLQVENISANTKFYLSENTVFGVDDYSTEQEFVFDPSSNLMAIGQRWGPVDGGSFEFLGTKDFNANSVRSSSDFASVDAPQAVAIMCEILTDIDGSKPQGPKEAWLGLVKWASGASPNLVILALAFIVSQLIQRGYSVTYERTKDGAKFTIQRRGFEGVPSDVKKDWDTAVAATAKAYPQIKLENDGIKDA
ncbi:hypothetical protein LY76DRAFT_688621 [Colletotrichum caudatum]|nr:hypothetical protein LY76DRAFT_688621 [Colletotrichum caudatum]